jgi:hypothetical protein
LVAPDDHRSSHTFDALNPHFLSIGAFAMTGGGGGDYRKIGSIEKKGRRDAV